MDDGAISREVRIEPLGLQHDVPAFECGVDSLDAFYRHHGFESSPTDPLHLLMLPQDIERAFPGKQTEFKDSPPKSFHFICVS